ncbi:MAG TPA: hypothetical protein VM184_00445 [Gaiellaceae bacterium]|nr:hypothetical protein [Gaiellaceae bacterium]
MTEGTKSSDGDTNIFVGVSRRDEETQTDPTLEEALKDAWEQAGGGDSLHIRVVDIEAYGSNPLDMYSVTVKAEPNQ